MAIFEAELDTVERMRVSGRAEGVTTDDYKTALDWDTRGLNKKTIVLKNTGSNSLDFTVDTYANESGVAYMEIPETTLSAGDVYKIVLNDVYARVVVSVKSTVSGSSTNYEIDWFGRMI